MDASECVGCGSAITPRTRQRGMPRKWCSGACRTRTGYPARAAAGLARAPRSAVFPKSCDECSRLFIGRSARGTTCSACRPARKARLERERYTADPAAVRERVQSYREMLPAQERARQAADAAERARRRGRSAAQRAGDLRRAGLKRAALVEVFDYAEVFERDGWVCQLCAEPIDRDLAWPDSGSVSLDHVVPLSRGGEHSRANTQAAHLRCNIVKSNRVPART